MLKTRNTGLVSRPRTAWAREGGAQERYSTARVKAAFKCRRRAGWLAVLLAAGPRHERVTVISTAHPVAAVAREYLAGVCWFDRCCLEQVLGAPLNNRTGARRLASAGFGMVQSIGSQVELRATDPRTALLVNRSRLGVQRRGYDEHKVVEALLCLPPRAKRRRAVNDDRRLKAAFRLHEDWLIDCDDLLACRPFVRLRSQWTMSA